jgi:ABC-type antimicrobial peptide transport system permease subunit
MRRFAIALLGGILGYGLGVVIGIGLVNVLGSPRPDSSMEAVMTGFFYVGPAAALLGFLGTLIYQLNRRPPR